MTTEKKYPVKECDYCDHVGMAYTTMAGETLCKSCLSDLPTDAAECRKLIVEQRKRIAELETELDKACNDLANFEGYPEEVSALRHDIERRKQRYVNILHKKMEWKKRAESAERLLEDVKDRLTSQAVDLIRCGIGGNYGGKFYEKAIRNIYEPINKLRQQLNGGE